ncbi:RNA-binding S4 domain-containing protein [Streptomyces sp. NPDC093261]|uniref:RNA-binding S4 domain-containing protein n=1 Tax=Streptomyces sp. NPDC093261 TaxID=3366037 RepID=UPI00382EFF85
MASEGTDDERAGGTGASRATATDQESGPRRDGGETAPRESGADTPDPDAAAQGRDPKTAAAVAAAEAAGPAPGESVRIDSWIWSVRLIKTRSAGATACRGGHVRVNGERVKPAHSVRIGDEVRLRHEGGERVVVVKRLIRKRVGAPVAVQCYVDNSPPPPPREAVAPAGIRDRGAGRPTKRDRREMERLRGLGTAPGSPYDGYAEALGAQSRAEGRGRTGGQGGSGGRGRTGGQGGSGGQGRTGGQSGTGGQGGSRGRDRAQGRSGSGSR